MLRKEQNELLTQTGPGTPTGRLFRSYWVPALLKEELPENDCPPVRVKILSEQTLKDNSEVFGSLESMPKHALTMGIGTILKARRIVLVATGEKKAECIRQTVNGLITTRVPASLLQVHVDVDLLLDRKAAALI